MLRRYLPTMRWLLFLALTFCLLAPALSAQKLRFAPLPLEDQKIVHEQFRGLVDFLQARIGQSIEWVHLNDYAEILQRFKAGEIDLAYLGPLPYAILARDFAKAEALGCFRDADGQADYTCALVSWGGSNMTPGTVTAARIGLTQPYSTCGYLAVSQILGAAGRRIDGDGNRFSYAGSHSNAALGVARGQYDVAGVKTAIAERYLHLNIKIIGTSQRYPGFALVANRSTIDDATFNALQSALLELDSSADSDVAEGMRSWGKQIRNGSVAPDQCDYSNVADALESLPWPLPGSQP